MKVDVRSWRFWQPIVDVIGVVVFAALGRGSHGEAVDALGIATTAWPFLVSLGIGWAIVLLNHWDGTRMWPAGVVIWFVTFSSGIALRLLSGATAAVPFIIVAAIVLALVLVGVRGIAALVRRIRRPAEAGSRS